MDVTDVENPKNLQTFCRTCMASEVDQTFTNYIFKDNAITDIYTLIKQFINIEIDINDGLPQTICNNCYNNLSLFQIFKNQCENMDKTLKEFIKVTHIKDDDYILNQNTFSCDINEENYILNENTYNCDINEDNIEIYIYSDSNFGEERNIESNVSNNKNVIKESYSNTKSACIENKKNLDVVKTENIVLSKPNLCALCYKEFPDNFRLCLHFINHALLTESTRNEHFSLQSRFCNECGEVLDGQSDLESHLVEHTVTKEDINWKCKNCNNMFTNDMDCLKHEAVCIEFHSQHLHLEKTQTIEVKCPICYLNFSTVEQLKQHSLNHILTKVKCRHCNRKFVTETAWQNHLELRHPEYKFKCKTCNKIFPSTKSLNVHVKGVHSNLNSYICSTCGKTFKSQVCLSNHTMVHNEERKFICSYCGYTTNKVWDLTTHTRIHTSERPYKCDYINCDKLFITTSQRLEHMRKHLQIRNFACSVCSKTFSRSSTLKFHTMTHTGEKPFTCNVCNVSFRRKDHLRNHSKKHINK